MSSTSCYYISLLVLAFLCNTAFGIQCHNCSSFTNPECATVSTTDGPTLVSCPEPDAFCRKTKQVLTDSGETRITRTCGSIKFEKHDGDYCMTSNTNFKQEISCQCFKDGCNSASNISSKIVVLGLAITAALLIF